MLTFEKMRPDERDVCAALAAQAFGDYEYFTDYIPNDRRRTRFLNAMHFMAKRYSFLSVIISNGPFNSFDSIP